MPQREPGAPCPVSHADTKVDFARFGIAVGLGSGPVYPVGMARGVLYLQRPTDSDAGSPWVGAKALWFVHPRCRGPVLIRGRRLDGPGLVRFDRGQVPPTQLFIRTGGLDRPSSTRLKGPGCYGYQIDGTSFSRIVVSEPS